MIGEKGFHHRKHGTLHGGLPEGRSSTSPIVHCQRG